MTRSIIKASMKCDKLYKTVIKLERSNIKYKNYLAYRNNLNYIKRRQKQLYYSNRINSFRSNSRKLWRFIKESTGKVNDKTSITSTFVINGKNVGDPIDISNHFNEFFASIGKTYASKIPKPKHNFKTYLTNKNENSLFLQPTNNEEILKIINSLSPKTSTGGEDHLNNKLLKHIALSIIQPLTVLSNKSLQEGNFPDGMKISKVIPLHKTGNKHIFNNYRPISLLPVLSKVLEKLVHNRLYNFLVDNKILYPSQYGFRPDHSTSHAITEFIGNIIRNLDKKIPP